MKKIAIGLLCALLVCLAPLALADGTSITAQGTAEISAMPDMFTIVSNVSKTEETVAEAQESVGTVISSVKAALTALGLEEKDIVTQSFSYYPQYEYIDNESRQTGYCVSHTLSVTCRDMAQLDSVLAALAACGMTDTWSVSFDVSTRSELYRQALALAMDAAGVKAEAMADASGLTVKRVESIEESSFGGVARYANAEDAVMSTASLGAGSGISSGDISVSASVTVVYEAE